MAAARDALPMPDAAVARKVLAADLALLAGLDRQIEAAAGELARLVAASPFKTLTTVPGWARSGSGTTPVPWVTQAGSPGRGRSTAVPG